MATKTIGASGKDYTTVAAWGAYVKALGTLTANEVGQMTDNAAYAWGATSDLDFSGVTLAGFTITLSSTNLHDGDFGNGARIEGSSNNYAGLYALSFCDLDDISISNTDTGDGGWGVLYNSYGCILRRSIFKRAGSNAGGYAVSGLATAAGALEMYACRVASVNNNGTGVEVKHSSTILHAVTSSGMTTGFSTSAAAEIKNCVSYNATTDFSGTWGTASNNASEDGTHSGANGVTITSNPFDVDGYTPSGSGQLDGAGVDLSISLDAANNSFNATPSIGAYEVIAAASTGIPILRRRIEART